MLSRDPSSRPTASQLLSSVLLHMARGPRVQGSVDDTIEALLRENAMLTALLSESQRGL